MATEARAHHVVSQCYLKGFTRDGTKDAQLFVVDVIERKSFPTAPANVAHRRDFNRIDGLPAGSLESALGRFEAEADLALRKLAEDRSLDDWDAWNTVLNLASLFAVRTPRMREQARSSVEALNKRILDVITATPELWDLQMRRAKASGTVAADAELSFEQVRAYLASDPLEVEMPVAMHVDREFRLQDDVLKLLGQRQWMLLIAEEGSGGFITSDQPLVLVPSDGGARPVGHALPRTTVFFPLTSALLAVGTFEGPAGVRLLSSRGVANQNSITLLHSDRQVYGPSGDARILAHEQFISLAMLPSALLAQAEIEEGRT
jgi:hypothetical protein